MWQSKVKQWFVLSMVASLLMMSWCLPGCGDSSSQLSVAPEVGALAPDFALPALNGETVSLEGLKGKPVVLNFWATWCGPCRVEIPYLQEAFTEKGEGISFVAINLREKEDKVKRFAYSMGMSFTIAMDLSGKVGAVYNIRGIPTTFFIDEERVIRHVKVGTFLNKGELMSLIEKLESGSM